MSYKPFVEHLIKSVVDNPDAIEIQEEVDRGTRTFFVNVAEGDVGKVIGKSGRVISNIRCLVSAIAARDKEKAFVKVVTE
jgi:predicted RNA-binding protein YlqC (UPF0109 family)